MSDYSFSILGSSSGMPQADRANSGYVLKCGENLILIDCGGGISSSFLRHGFDPLKVHRIFISHTHPDHVSDLPLFIQMIYLAGNKEPLDIYLPEEFVEPFKNYLRSVYIILEKMPFDINIHGYFDGFVYDNHFKLTAHGNRHLEGYMEYINKLHLPNKMQCHSFVIECGYRQLLYSADIFDLSDIHNLLADTHIALVESTHIELDAFAELAGTFSRARFILTHLGNEQEIEKLKGTLQKYKLNNVELAHDGLKIEY